MARENLRNHASIKIFNSIRLWVLVVVKVFNSKNCAGSSRYENVLLYCSLFLLSCIETSYALSIRSLWLYTLDCSRRDFCILFLGIKRLGL